MISHRRRIVQTNQHKLHSQNQEGNMFVKRVISHSISFFFIMSLVLMQVGTAYATGSGDMVGTGGMPVQAADPYQAPYYLKASPADDWIHARGWSEGAILELTIRNAGETDSYNTTAVVAQSPWNPNELDDKVAIFDLAGNWNVQVGDVATVTDGTEEEFLTVADITQIHWLSGGYQTDGPAVTASQDAAHSYNLAHPEIELLYIVGWPGDNADYPADIFGPQGILNSNFLKGEWLDLDPLITSSGYDTSQFAPQLMDLFYNDDEGQYGLPFAAFPNMLYYQKGMFDLAGLNYPPANYDDLYVLDGEAVEWNIDTMYEVAKRLTLDGSGKNATEAGFNPNTIIQYGYVPQWQAATGIASLWGAGSIVGGTPGAYTASIPSQWTLAWKAYYSGLWGQEVFIPNGPAISNPEFGEGNSFNSGKIAMATAQAWYLCCIADAGANWEIGVPPSYQGTVNGVFHSDSFRIHKNSLHQQEAFDALVYLLDNASLIEAFDQMPARTSAQATFLAEKETQYPFVDNWHLLQDGLSYIENPSNESWMPNLEIAWERLSQFQDRLLNYSDLNIDNEIVILRWGLEHIFNTGINPGWPHFVVRANEDRVEGWEWPDGATVTIEIKRGGIVQTTETAEVGPAPWNPNEIRFEYNFSGEFDILAGDIVTVTDGTLTKSVTVSIHSITEINVDDDIVYGVSDPGVRIDVWACENSSCDYNRHAISDPTTGEWQVDFSIAGDEQHEQN